MIYVASKIKHAPMWRALRAQGVPIISYWIDHDNVVGDSLDLLPGLWNRCLIDVIESGVLVAYQEKGEQLKGGLIEIGCALGNNVPVIGVGLQDYTFRFAPGMMQWPDMNVFAAMAHAQRLVENPLHLTGQANDRTK